MTGEPANDRRGNKPMNCRNLVRRAGLGVVAATTLAAPAIGQTMPEVKWRMTSSFPKSLDTIDGAGEQFARRVAQLTDNKFQIRIFAAGEIIPGLQALDAVQNGTVESAIAPYYYVGKDPTFAFDTAVPFGLNTRQHTAWVYHGGGLELMREFYREKSPRSCCPIPARRWAAGSARRSRPRTTSRASRCEIGGFAGQVLAKLGVIAQQLAGGDIYPALEKGVIDPRNGSGRTTTRSWASTRLRHITTIPDGGRVAPRCRFSSISRRWRHCRRPIAMRWRSPRATWLPGPWRNTTRKIPARCANWSPAAPSCCPFRPRCWKPASMPPRNSMPKPGGQPALQEGSRPLHGISPRAGALVPRRREFV